MPELSVVIATFNRPASLVRILGELAAQTIAKERYEVVVVDDGSKEPVLSRVEAFRATDEGKHLRVRVERQKNAGAAAARQRGAELAEGNILVILDDDMLVPRAFLESHLAAHVGDDLRVVMGRLKADGKLAEMPLFERFYAQMLDRTADQVRAARKTLRGPDLYTGNLSLSRDLFFRAGGFDTTFGQIEDAELGVRLEKCGATFHLSEEAFTIHASDHTSRDKWLARSIKDGLFWTRLARKHPEAVHANPWRFLTGVNPLSRPVLGLVVALPALAKPLARTAFGAATAADKLGLGRLAVGATTLVYGIQYFHGVRTETGSIGDVFREYRAFRKGLARAQRMNELPFWDEVKADHAALTATQDKYGTHASRMGTTDASSRSITKDAVNNIGFQLLIGYRLMRYFVRSGQPLAAKFCSRLLRHLYGSDIHWDADFDPGIVIVHGFGLAVAGGVKVERGCILFQHVTLGTSLHPETRQAGAPHLERDVHVGVGSTIVGPIVVGKETKIMAHCVVIRDVPERSLVESPMPETKKRADKK
ncbi:MAG: glycosyltransferase [Polyangiaceae bacterium]